MAIIQKLSAFLGSAKQEARAPEQRVVERAVAMPEPVEATLNALAAVAGTPVFHPVPHYRIKLLGHLLGTPQTGRKLSPVVRSRKRYLLWRRDGIGESGHSATQRARRVALRRCRRRSQRKLPVRDPGR